MIQISDNYSFTSHITLNKQSLLLVIGNFIDPSTNAKRVKLEGEEENHSANEFYQMFTS